MVTDLITMKDAEFFQAVYRRGLALMSRGVAAQKVLFALPNEKRPLSHLDIMSVLAVLPSIRKDAINRYIRSGKDFSIATTGILSWVIANAASEFSHSEKIEIEEYFTKLEEGFDGKINSRGLLDLGDSYDWSGQSRRGILIENQAYYAKILDLLSLLTNDDIYAFKKKRLIRSVREKLDGAYVLDRADSLEMTINPFLAAFFAPELFRKEDWEKTFDSLLKSENLWIFWGGLRTLSQSDENFIAARNGESWFFINNIVAIVLYRLNLEKYRGFINKIILASSKNINWQEHAGRPCELVMTADNKIRLKDFCSLTLATYIYLYRSIAL